MQGLAFIGRFKLLLFYLAIVWSGCATETLKPTFPTSSTLKRPDRVLVYEFAVTSADLDRPGIVGSGLNRPAAQTDEEIRIGRALAKALSENLVTELRRRGIDASLASETGSPGEDTAIIRGQFQPAGQDQDSAVGFTLRGKELRTRIRILQGSGLDLRVVAESDYTMPRTVTSGMTADALANAVNADSNRAAQGLAERVTDYYRKQGWLK
jgi:hypothetical protein